MKQNTLFIADLHLTPQAPDSLNRFIQFLTDQAKHWEKIYILGDLFEVWLGDDEDEPAYQQVIQNLRSLTAQGILVFIMRGNRDFLLDQQFSQMTGCQLITDPTVIDLYGTPTLLMHGDTLCTKDTAYQTFRQQVRNPQWQQQFLAQPLIKRRLIAQQARLQSQQYTQQISDDIMDVTQSEVIRVMQQYDVVNLIHGHTHRPAIHQFLINNQNAWRKVVGAWYKQECLGLCYTPIDFQLKQVI